jgi:hypothetical protein
VPADRQQSLPEKKLPDFSIYIVKYMDFSSTPALRAS